MNPEGCQYIFENIFRKYFSEQQLTETIMINRLNRVILTFGNIMINATLSERVHEILRERIITGILKPYDRLLYAVIAEELQVSLSPVKEALLHLEHEGLVTINPRKGAFVRQISSQDITEYSWIRLALESLALEQVCNNGLRPEDKEALYGLNEELAASIDKKDIVRCMHLDNEFHAQIVNSSKLVRLIETTKSLPLVNFSIVSGHKDYIINAGKQICRTHSDIIKAMEKKDIQLAKVLLKKNIIEPLESLINTA
jgi:DNA-binding GntR family transcriptional regulator